ncbi:unnamed protein product, partial [Amoebophrya sp. A25]
QWIKRIKRRPKRLWQRRLPQQRQAKLLQWPLMLLQQAPTLLQQTRERAHPLVY